MNSVLFSFCLIAFNFKSECTPKSLFFKLTQRAKALILIEYCY
jgi:hypothetical protein